MRNWSFADLPAVAGGGGGGEDCVDGGVENDVAETGKRICRLFSAGPRVHSLLPSLLLLHLGSYNIIVIGLQK